MRDYCGWRARLGLIYMASSTVMEPEFYAMAPEGVATLVARLHLPKATVAGLTAMMEGEEVERCAESLANADLHVIAFGGTSATFLNGPAWDEKVKARMASRSKGRPVTATSSASVKALQRLGVKRMTFLGPYVDEVTERGRRFFAASGFEVLGAHGMGIAEDHDIGNVALERVYDFARRHTEKGSDGIFISCTNLRTVGAIAALETDLGLPVVTAIQATFWDSLRLAGVKDRVQGFGALFAH